MRRPNNYIQIIIKLISRWTFGNNDKNVTKMNNDGAIQSLLLIVVEEYCCYCHRLIDVKGEETCVSHHKGQRFTSSDDDTIWRRNVCFPSQGLSRSTSFCCYCHDSNEINMTLVPT